MESWTRRLTTSLLYSLIPVASFLSFFLSSFSPSLFSSFLLHCFCVEHFSSTTRIHFFTPDPCCMCHRKRGGRKIEKEQKLQLCMHPNPIEPWTRASCLSSVRSIHVRSLLSLVVVFVLLASCLSLSFPCLWPWSSYQPSLVGRSLFLLIATVFVIDARAVSFLKILGRLLFLLLLLLLPLLATSAASQGVALS